MAFTLVTVFGTVQDANGSPAVNAAVHFVLSASILDMETGITVAPTPIVVRTDSSGNFSADLFATDDSTTKPSGQVYKCEIQVPGATLQGLYGSGAFFPTYYFALPHSAAPQVNLVQLISQFALPGYTGPGFQPGYYDQTSALAETMPRRLATGSNAMTTGTLFMNYFTPGWDVSIQHITVFVNTVASGTTNTIVGVFSVDSSDNATLLGSVTAGSLLTASGARTAALASPLVLNAGHRYAVGILWAGSTAPYLAGATVQLGAIAPRITGAVSSQVVMPSAVSNANVVPNPASTWVRLS